MMDTISEVMGSIGLYLMPIVLVALAGLALWVCELVGENVVESVRRIVLRRASIRAGRSGTWHEWLAIARTPRGSLLSQFQNALQTEGKGLDEVLEDLDFHATRKLNLLSIGIRIGPVLGLMGTLIPLGPALLQLRPDNLSEFSHGLSIAFGATVIGLFISGVCYVLVYFRKLWDMEDMASIDRWMRMNDGIPVLIDPATNDSVSTNDGSMIAGCKAPEIRLDEHARPSITREPCA